MNEKTPESIPLNKYIRSCLFAPVYFDHLIVCRYFFCFENLELADEGTLTKK